MADDRAVEGLVEMVTRLQAELTDLRSTVMVRRPLPPTGSMIATFAAVAPEGTLLLQGQTVLRADYPALWQWATDHGAVTGNAFGPGNGSTTFTLPDLRGRILIGVGTLGADVYALGDLDGAAFRSILTANIPAHDHNVGGSGTASSAGLHGHGGSTGSAGGHAGHNSGSTNAASALPGSQDFIFSVASTTQNTLGAHTHSLTINDAGGHTHPVTVSITESSVGSGIALDIRQPSLAGNWAIYT